MNKIIFKELIKYLLLILLSILILFPLYYLIVLSLKSTDEVSKEFISLKVENITFSNFKDIIDKKFWLALLLSTIALLFLSILRMVVYTLTSVGLIKMSYRNRKIFLTLFFIISLIPEFSTYLGMKIILNKFDLINNATFISIVVNGIFSYFILMNIYKTMDKTFNENKIRIFSDNLSSWQKIKLVYLPNLKISYLLLIIFTVTSVWNDYLWPVFILSGYEQKTISIWFQQLGSNGSGGFFANLQAAGSLISISIPLLIYLAFSKIINKNIY